MDLGTLDCGAGKIAWRPIADSIVFRSLTTSVLLESVFARSISAADRSNSLMSDEIAPEDRMMIGIAETDCSVRMIAGEDLPAPRGSLPATAGFSASAAMRFSISETLLSISRMRLELAISRIVG